RRFSIPPRTFLALLLAFEQDQRVKRYDTCDRLLSYCNCSANPVGHLVLMLFECFDARRLALADQVCTGLQLANFWQDVARDHAHRRRTTACVSVVAFGPAPPMIRSWLGSAPPPRRHPPAAQPRQ